MNSLKIPKGLSEAVNRRRQHNGQKKSDKRTNNDLKNITWNTTDRAT